MDDYLYLTPFTDQQFFKIGISSVNFKRIFYLNHIYNTDLQESLIVICEEEMKHIYDFNPIKFLEQELLKKFPVNNHVLQKSEWSNEIREIKFFLPSIEHIIEHNHFYYKIFKFNELIAANIKLHNLNSLRAPEIKRPYLFDTEESYNFSQIMDLNEDLEELIQNYKLYAKFYNNQEFKLIIFGKNENDYYKIREIYNRNKLFFRIYHFPKIIIEIGSIRRIAKFNNIALQLTFNFSPLKEYNSYLNAIELDSITKFYNKLINNAETILPEKEKFLRNIKSTQYEYTRESYAR